MSLPTWVPNWIAETTAWKIHDADEDFDAANGFKHEHTACHNGVLLVRGKQMTKICKVASHSFRDFAEEYDAGNLHKYLGTATLFPQIITEIDRIMGHREQSKQAHLRLLLMTLTCGGIADWLDDPVGPRALYTPTDIVELAEARGGAWLYRCVGRKIAMIDHASIPIALVPEFGPGPKPGHVL